MQRLSSCAARNSCRETSACPEYIHMLRELFLRLPTPAMADRDFLGVERILAHLGHHGIQIHSFLGRQPASIGEACLWVLIFLLTECTAQLELQQCSCCGLCMTTVPSVWTQSPQKALPRTSAHQPGKPSPTKSNCLPLITSAGYVNFP